MMPLGNLFAVWSFRKELKYVLLGFGVLISLPIIAVIILTQTGINIVSDKLATSDPQTQSVQILDPHDGKLTKEISKKRIWPIKGVITTEFGGHTGYQLFHTGIDIAAPSGKVGDPVAAFMDGTVTYAGEISWGYGKHVIIDHGDHITSVYGHLDKIFVYKGQVVEAGEVIGNRGTTGWSTGPHLHFEIRVFGIPVNPRTFLK
jgi:murein DD-endopeptidase MepM/ murein hydrolase activator NlpD